MVTFPVISTDVSGEIIKFLSEALVKSPIIISSTVTKSRTAGVLLLFVAVANSTWLPGVGTVLFDQLLATVGSVDSVPTQRAVVEITSIVTSATSQAVPPGCKQI
jgi:hypothetical protein